MKRLFTSIILTLFLFTTTHTYAKIWRVNNNSGVAANFTAPQAAHDVANAGDTIHIEPSATDYAGINVSKRLVIIGNGYELATDTGLQANSNSSTISGGISFYAGSAGSVVQGIKLTGYTYVQDSNITIRRCNITYPTYVYSKNFTFTNNWVYYYGVTDQAGGLSGINISNNIFYYYGNTAISFGATSTGNFTNNTCYNSTISCYNFQVNNNILLNGSFSINNNVYFNNIGNSTQFGSANGNQENVSGNIFTQTGNYQQEQYWLLIAGSPAIGAGYGGVDCGAYGGPNPYRLAGIPNVPTIYKLTIPPVGTTNINVTISTKSNN